MIQRAHTAPRAIAAAGPGRAAAAGARCAAGFTLLELVIVMGVISMLLGLGIGFLQRGGTDLDAALMVMRDQVRLAVTTAQATSLPTEVDLLPQQDGSTEVQTRALRSVGTWHFEEGERFLDERLRPVTSGRLEPGRFGSAMRPTEDTKESMMALAGQGDLFNLESGFALRIDLRLDERRQMAVARLGRAFELGLDGELRPTARTTLAGGGGPGEVIDVAGREPVRLGVWITLELVHDGRELSLLVDQRQVAAAPARGIPYQQPDDSFEVSLGNLPVRGLVDEVRLLAYERGEAVQLPALVELSGLQGPIRFGRRGELIEPRPARFKLAVADDSVEREIAPGGVLR